MKILLASIMLLLTLTTSSQVTIGSAHRANIGALLDLKEEDKLDGTANSTKGLMLPRVKLTEKTTLVDIGVSDPSGYVGIMVYNVNEVAGMCAGIYIWTGVEWTIIGTGCFYIRITPSEIVYYKTPDVASPRSFTIDAQPEGIVRYIIATGNLAWETGFSPEHLTGTTNQIIKVVPTINATGNEQASSLEVYVERAGTRTSEYVTVTQLAQDIMLEVTKDALYPAVGGEQSFSVKSLWERNWNWQASKETDADAILSVADVVSKPKHTVATPYQFTLAPNPAFAVRTATIRASLTNFTYINQAIEIKQDYVPLYMELTNPAQTTIDMGVVEDTEASSEEIFFKTNAPKWKMIDVYGNINDLLSGWSPYFDAEYIGSASALELVNRRISLKGDNGINYENIKGGDELSMTIRLSTAGHEGIAPATQDIVIKRTIKSYLSVNEIQLTNGTVVLQGGTLPQMGCDIYVIATANIDWDAGWKLETDIAMQETVSHTVTGNTIRMKSQKLTIPQNTTGNVLSLKIAAWNTEKNKESFYIYSQAKD